MNFMPSEDAFFDEPLVDEHVSPPAATTSYAGISRTHEHRAAVPSELVQSSLRQEKLLERIVSELENMNGRLSTLERIAPGHAGLTPAAPVAGTPSRSPPKSRGAMALPPGSRPAAPPTVAERKPIVSAADDAVARERQEYEAIQRRRAEEDARLARIEAERLEREAEEERKRVAEMERMEEERRMKEELEKKTRGLMTGLLTGGGTGGLFGDDDFDDTAASAGGKKKGGGLFDD